MFHFAHQNNGLIAFDTFKTIRKFVNRFGGIFYKDYRIYIGIGIDEFRHNLTAFVEYLRAEL